MRTSRPMKHSPKPLLSANTKSSRKGGKGKGRAQQESEEPANTSDVYSFDRAASGMGSGARKAAARLKNARQAVREEAGSTGKGKGKARQLDDEEDEDGVYGNGMPDLSRVKFRLGLASDDEDGEQAGNDTDDEEIDSDLASTDHEEEMPVVKPKRGQQPQAGPSQSGKRKRQIASDFYDNDDNVEIDLDENVRAGGRLNGLQSNGASSNEDEENLDGGSDSEYVLLSDMWDKHGVSSTAPSTTNSERGNQAPSNDDAGLLGFKPGHDAVESEAEDSASEDEEEYSDSDEAESEDVELDDSDIEDDPAALDKLDAIISSLPSGGQAKQAGSALDTDISASTRKKRRLVDMPERTEIIPESQFAVTNSNGAKLTLDMLLGGLPSEQAASLRKTLKPLANASSAGKETDTTVLGEEVARLTAAEKAILERERQRKQDAKLRNPLKMSGALPAPLAPLHQAKIERQAARERMDDEIHKWDDTVKATRGIAKDGADQTEQRLVLPYQTENVSKGETGASLIAKYQPSNDLEKRIDSLISSTGMSQSALLSTETSALMEALPQAGEASKAHDHARIAQLRLARDLMFRAERKATRLAKIKSRTFRKIAKKSRERDALKNGDAEDGALTLDELQQLDALDGGERAQAERERLEILRARERATLRHASASGSASAGGRWSKSLRPGEAMDDNVKEAIRKRDSTQAMLRRKILGQDEDEDDSQPSDVDDDEDESDDSENLHRSTLKELDGLDIENQGELASSVKPKGLLGMKFMQKGMARENARLHDAVDDFKAVLEQDLGDDNDFTASPDARMAGGSMVKSNPGRMVFGPTRGQNESSVTAPAEDVTTSRSNGKKRKRKDGHTSKTSGIVAIEAPSSASAASSATLLDYNPFSKMASLAQGSSDASKEINPWLAPGESHGQRLSRKTNEVSGGQAGTALEKSAAKLGRKLRTKRGLTSAQSEATIEIDVDKVLIANPSALDTPTPATGPATPHTVVAEGVTSRKRKRGLKSSNIAEATDTLKAYADGDRDSNSDNDEDALPESVARKQGPQAFKQRDLVARAFAGDNVVADFEELKQAQIEADAPREEDLTLPGWGSWGGKGVRKQKNARKIVKQIPGVDASKRQDAKYKNVIISERVDKKAQKYLTKDLPYPYTSIAQYEQKMAQPTGNEWTTRATFKDAIAPKVLTKPGVVIKPIARPVQ